MFKTFKILLQNINAKKNLKDDCLTHYNYS